MLEKPVIQARGFHNIVKDGEVIGFQVKVRSTYYRGIYLSQLRPGSLVVDGEVFPRDSVIWEIGGKEYTPPEMKSVGDVHWDLAEPATLKVIKPGGLSQGYHDIEARFAYSSSYLPPQLQEGLDPDEDRGRNIFGAYRFHRTLLIV